MKLLSSALAVLLLQQGAAQQPAPVRPDTQKPVFRSRVELLAVDVSVVDSQGRPVQGLAPADFTVTVGGKRRNVVRAEFIDFTQAAAAPTEVAEVSSNQAEAGVPEPRTILLAVDDGAFNPAEGKIVFLRLADQVERMFPRDPMGFLPLSGQAKAIEFTTDRKPIADALRVVTGQRSSLSGMTNVRLGVGEAIDIDQGRDPIALEQAVGRECAGMSGPDLEACRRDVQAEARTIADEAGRQADQTVMALGRIFDSMASVPGTKYVLFVTPGFALGRSQAMATALSQHAAAAGVRLHAFYVERNVMDASIDRISPRAFGDATVMAEGLQLAVDASGGAMHRIIGDPANAIERVRREMTGMYRLGVEMDPLDADGKPRSIDVKVSRPGLSTRSYRQIIAPASTADLAPAERLKRALQSPMIDREIGVRLGTFLYRDDTGTGRVLVSAEVDAPPEGLKAAFVIRDSRGKPVSAVELGSDAVIVEKDAPPLLVFATPVPPGDYNVKLALVDGEGRVGSAVRSISVTSGVPDTLVLGDLVVLSGGQAPNRARPSTRIAQGSRQAAVYFELYGDAKTATKATVHVDVTDTPEGVAIVSSEGSIAFKAKGKMARAAGQLKFSPVALPAGRYFARLRVDGSDARALRSFTITAGTSAALLADESRALVPLFSVQRFLSPSLLHAVSSRLVETGGDNPAVSNVASSLEDDTWRDLSTVTGNRVVDSTLKGLQALAAGQPADAERLFRDALDADPEFTIALALVGGAWASVGREPEASRSWRTSLATGIDAPFLYPFVADSLLRMGDVKGTRDFIAEVQEGGSDASSLERPRALAAAIAGDRRETVASLGKWVDAHPDDQDATFVLVLALYELKTIDKDASVAPEFERRAKQYVERGGPRQALVARWLR
jgi:VWFA-related protein